MWTERCRVRAAVCALGALVALWGCSSSGGGGGGGAKTSTVAVKVDLPVAMKSVSAAAGISQITSVYNVPAGMGPSFAIHDGTVDLAATLGAATNVVLKAARKAGGPAGARGAAGDSVAELSVRVGPASDIDTVCATGFPYGPFAVTETALGGLAVDPPTARASRQTLSVINTGSAAVCVQINADRDVQADIDSVALDVTTCNAGADSIGGDWTGTYSCTNTPGCGDDFGDIFLVILQERESHTAKYNDDEAEYSGTVCGNVFTFAGGVPGDYDESGTFTQSPTQPGKATKHSEWHSVIPGNSCGGVCDDVLTQIAEF